MGFSSFRFTRALIALPLALAAATLAIGMPAQAQTGLGTQIAAALPDQGEIHLGLFNEGDRDGFMRLGWIKSADGVLVYDRSMMPSGEIYEAMAIALAPDMTLENVELVFHRGTARMGLDLAFANGQAAGHRTISRLESEQVQDVEFAVPAGTLPRALAFLMPLVLPEEAGSEARFHWYGPLGNAFADITITAHPGGMVETPAGSFDTTRYEIRGGAPDNDVFVTHGENRRVVRIDVIGSELQFLALPEPEAE